MEKDKDSGHFIHEITGRPYLWVSTSGLPLMRKIYVLNRKIQPYLCKVGVHDIHDVCEIDGSVITGYCGSCSKLVKPRKPQPPNPEEAKLLDEFNEFCCCDGECNNKSSE